MMHMQVLNMDLEKPTLEQSQETGLTPTLLESIESTRSKRARRRWWPWLLAFCLLVAAAYAVHSHMGKADKSQAWKTRLTQMAVAAYEKPPLPGQGTTQSSQTPGKPGSDGKAAAAPAPRTPPTVPVVATAVKQ